MDYKKQIEEAIEKKKVYSTSELGYEDFRDQEFYLTMNGDSISLDVRISQSIDWSVSQEGCKEVGYNDIYDVESVSIYLKILDIFDNEGNSIKESFHIQEIQHLENLLEDYVEEMQEDDQMPTTKADLL